MKYKKLVRNIFLTIAALVFGVIFFTLFATVFVERNAENRLYTEVKNIPRNRVALLLGTTPINYWGKPSPTFVSRLNSAAELYHSGKADTILASGSDHFHNLDEVSAMRDGLIERGVPEANIIIDTCAYRTAVSIERAKSVYGLDSLTIVSQASHSARALMLADKYGVKAVAVCAPDTGKLVFPIRSMVREWLARDKLVFESLFTK